MDPRIGNSSGTRIAQGEDAVSHEEGMPPATSLRTCPLTVTGLLGGLPPRSHGERGEHTSFRAWSPREAPSQRPVVDAEQAARLGDFLHADQLTATSDEELARADEASLQEAIARSLQEDAFCKLLGGSEERGAASKTISLRTARSNAEEGDVVPSEVPTETAMGQLSNFADLNRDFRGYLESNGMHVLPNSGNASNCAFYALVQHLRPDAPPAAIERDVKALRSDYDRLRPRDRGLMIFFDDHQQGGAASTVIGLVNARYGVNVQVGMVEAGMSSAHPVTDKGRFQAGDASGGFTHRVVIWDQQHHYEAVTTKESDASKVSGRTATRTAHADAISGMEAPDELGDELHEFELDAFLKMLYEQAQMSAGEDSPADEHLDVIERQVSMDANVMLECARVSLDETAPASDSTRWSACAKTVYGIPALDANARVAAFTAAWEQAKNFSPSERKKVSIAFASVLHCLPAKDVRLRAWTAINEFSGTLPDDERTRLDTVMSAQVAFLPRDRRTAAFNSLWNRSGSSVMTRPCLATAVAALPAKDRQAAFAKLLTSAMTSHSDPDVLMAAALTRLATTVPFLAEDTRAESSRLLYEQIAALPTELQAQPMDALDASTSNLPENDGQTDGL